MKLQSKVKSKLPNSVWVRFYNDSFTPRITFRTSSNKAKRVISNHAKYFAKLLRKQLISSNHPDKNHKMFFITDAVGNLTLMVSHQYPALEQLTPILPALDKNIW